MKDFMHDLFGRRDVGGILEIKLKILDLRDDRHTGHDISGERVDCGDLPRHAAEARPAKVDRDDGCQHGRYVESARPFGTHRT